MWDSKMTILCVRHRTEFQYRQPVLLGEHRLMSRPRDSHDLRLLDTALMVAPGSSFIVYSEGIVRLKPQLVTLGTWPSAVTNRFRAR